MAVFRTPKLSMYFFFVVTSLSPRLTSYFFFHMAHNKRKSFFLVHLKQYPLNPPVKQRPQKFMEIQGRQLWFYTKCLLSCTGLNWCLGCNHYSRAFQRESWRWAVSTIAVSWGTERGTLRTESLWNPWETCGIVHKHPAAPVFSLFFTPTKINCSQVR